MRNYFDPIDNSYGAVPDGDPIPAGCIAVTCQPKGDFERHDDKGNLVVDAAAKADFEAGQHHIQQAHAVKSIEATLILAGIEVDGLLKAEAEALGIDLTDLANAVREKQALFVATEIERRAIKVKGASNA